MSFIQECWSNFNQPFSSNVYFYLHNTYLGTWTHDKCEIALHLRSSCECAETSSWSGDDRWWLEKSEQGCAYRDGVQEHHWFKVKEKQLWLIVTEQKPVEMHQVNGSLEIFRSRNDSHICFLEEEFYFREGCLHYDVGVWVMCKDQFFTVICC